MKRREFLTKSAVAVATVGFFNYGFSREIEITKKNEGLIKRKKGKTIAFLIFPEMTPLDIIGPATAFDIAGLNIEYVWHDKKPIKTELNGIFVTPTITFDELNCVDIICVPGASNPFEIIMDEKAVKWLSEVGKNAEYVTSVCTGALVLAAAGLLDGYKASTHWSRQREIEKLGAIFSNERVTIDRNRITGGGVTAGIDFGLTLLSILESENSAKLTQLIMQYDPLPPFEAGTPEKAGKYITNLAEKIGMENLSRNAPDYKERIEKIVGK